MRVNSPGALPAAGGLAGFSGRGVDGADWNIRVNSPGCPEAGGAAADAGPGIAAVVPEGGTFCGAAGIDPDTARTRLERGLRIVKALVDAGVPVVVGTDEGVPGHSVHREIELYVDAGLTPMQALQAATIVPARAMRLDQELGTSEKGKRADMVVLNADPLEQIGNIRSVRWTISDGRVYDSPALWRSVKFQP